jgi:hypothetical protein
MTPHTRTRSSLFQTSLLAARPALVALALVLPSATTLAGDCPESTHGCFATGEPGCTDTDCCIAVCGADPFCCNAAWDNSCVNLAFTICGAPPCDFTCPPGAKQEGEACGEKTNDGCNLPILGDSSCCQPHGSPGCDDFDCELSVCNVEPFCCDFDWDGFCVSIALEVCPTVCELGAAQYTPIACGDTICGTTWAADNVQDTDWYEFTLTSTQEVTFSATTTLALRIGIVDNDGVPDCSITSALSPSLNIPYCSSGSITACLGPGTYWFVVAPVNFGGFPCSSGTNDYSITMTCGGECVPPTCGATSVGSCFEASNSPYCNDESCCNDVCVINPFCCDVAWDVTCVGEAKTYCVTCDLVSPPGTVAEAEPCGEDTNGGCNLPLLGDSNCCVANGGLGCDDMTCQIAVCEFDSFCCEAFWDAICGTYAWTLCPDVCPLGDAAFEPIACGMSIRGTAWAEDGFKDTDWYEITVDEITPITFRGTAEFPLLIGVVDTGGSADCVAGSAYGQLNPLALANPCTEASISTCLEPGTWYLFVAPQVTFGWPCVADGCNCPDLNASGMVDGADLGILLGAWGTDDACANLDGEGTVSGADLGILLGAWGPYTCPSPSKNEYVVTLECGGECTGPANDFCQDAAPITVGNTEFSTVGATSGGPILPASCDEGFDLLFVRDIWYVYTAPESGVLTVSTCNQASFDTRLAAYTGSCSDLNLVGCNDDGQDCFLLTSIMQFGVSQGQTYYIRVGSYADFGSGTLTLTLE